MDGLVQVGFGNTARRRIFVVVSRVAHVTSDGAWVVTVRDSANENLILYRRFAAICDALEFASTALASEPQLQSA
jgi:hypothetical protein